MSRTSGRSINIEAFSQLSNSGSGSGSNISSGNSFSSGNNFIINNNQTIKDEFTDTKLRRGRFNNKKDSVNMNRFLNQRSYGQTTNNHNLYTNYGLHHLVSNNLLKEDPIDLGEIDKCYSSCWLDDDFVVCGTKCSKLVLIYLKNKSHYHLPVVESRNKTDKKSGGIYSIAINPSRTLLATHTKDGNDIAIYGLPSMDILYLLENGHTDCIFDIQWLDDHYLVSGSFDSYMVLWKVGDESEDEPELDFDSKLYKMKIVEPLNRFSYSDVEKIRCINFNKKRSEIGVLSLNTRLHLIDAQTMKKKDSMTLPYKNDLVCLAHEEDANLYAVGSKSHINLIDSRSLTNASTINAKTPECGIRSLSFNNDILTIGTGNGQIMFYDLRNSRYFYFMNNQLNHEVVTLKTSKGYIRPNNLQERFGGHFTQLEQPAIYSHEYDKTKTRLLVCGGPINFDMVGNYCAIWS